MTMSTQSTWIMRVQKFTSDGQFIAAFGTTGDDTSQFSQPQGIDIDNSDHVYVT